MPRNTVTRECHVGLYMAIRHRILEPSIHQPQPHSLFLPTLGYVLLLCLCPCPWRSSSSSVISIFTFTIFFFLLSNSIILVKLKLSPFHPSAKESGQNDKKKKEATSNSVVCVREPKALPRPINYFFNWVTFSL